MQTDIEVRQPAAIERNKAIVLKFYGEHDLKVQGDLLAPEFVGRAPGVPRFDRAGFLRGLAELYDAFPDGRYVNDNIVAEGDQVVTVGRFQGTHTGAFHGMPPTGKRVTLTAVHVDRIVGGKIVEHLRMSDPNEILEQIQPDASALASGGDLRRKTTKATGGLA